QRGAAFAELDVRLHLAALIGARQRAEVDRRIARAADPQRPRALHDELGGAGVRAGDRLQPRAGRALRALEAVGRHDDAARGGLEVAPRVVDDDGILATHLR